MHRHLFFSPDDVPGTTQAPAVPPVTVPPLLPANQPAQAPNTPAPDPIAALAARLDAMEKANAEKDAKIAKLTSLRTNDTLKAAVAGLKWPELLETSAFAGAKEVDETGNLTPTAQAKIADIRKMHPEWFGTEPNPGVIPSTLPPSGAPQVMSPSDWFKMYDDPNQRAKALSPDYAEAVRRGRLQGLK